MSIPERILMGPGPSDVPSRTLLAMARPTIGHLDPAFLNVMDELRTMLRQLFRTQNEMTLAVSGTGSAGMETLCANLIEPGERVLVCINGVFGTRMADVAGRCGAEVETIEMPWGRVFDQDEIITAIERHQPKVVGIVHAETSTGAHQPLDRLGPAARQHGALLMVDCVTSLGGAPVEIDAWQIDAAYSGTQKCLSCPPGLAPITLNDRAVTAIENRRNKVQSWYLDLTMVRNYWGGDRAYHHTAPVNMLYGLHEALRIVFEEGLEARWQRHREHHLLLREALSELGITYVSEEGHHLPMLNAVAIPDGLDDGEARRRLLDEYNLEIGAGLGAFKGKAWRIGLMGHACSRANIAVLIGALRDMLR